MSENKQEQNQDVADAFFGGNASAIPSMKRRTKSAAQLQKDKAHEKSFFGWMWVFLAVTTFVFGFRNLPELFVDMLSWTPFSPQTILTMSSWAGAFMGLAFLDGAYHYWAYLGLNNAETPEQIAIADWAEDVAFYGSVYFTGAVILSLFPSIPDYIIHWMSVLGAIVFVLATVNSMICMYYFKKKSVLALELRNQTKTESDQTKEILDMYKTLQEDMVGLTRDKLQDLIPDLSERMAVQLSENVARTIDQQIGAPPTNEPSKKSGKK